MEDEKIRNRKFLYQHLSHSSAYPYNKREIIALFAESRVIPQLKYEKIIMLGRSLQDHAALKNGRSFLGQKVPERNVSRCRTCRRQGPLSVLFRGAYFRRPCRPSHCRLSRGASRGDPSCPPHFLEELGIHASLSPSRSNGLASLFLRMKQHALNFLVSSNSV